MDAVTFGGIVFLFVVCAVIGMRAAYRNGVTDGYGYSREPNCPGYAVAGDWLRAHMMHRWPELKEEDALGAVGHTQRRVMAVIDRDWPHLNKASEVLLCAWLVMIGERRGEELGGKHRTQTTTDAQRQIAQYLLRIIPKLEDGSRNMLAAWLYWFGRKVDENIPDATDGPEVVARKKLALLKLLTEAAETGVPGAPYILSEDIKRPRVAGEEDE